jgi:hypothetical protein
MACTVEDGGGGVRGDHRHCTESWQAHAVEPTPQPLSTTIHHDPSFLRAASIVNGACFQTRLGLVEQRNGRKGGLRSGTSVAGTPPRLLPWLLDRLRGSQASTTALSRVLMATMVMAMPAK